MEDLLNSTQLLSLFALSPAGIAHALNTIRATDRRQTGERQAQTYARTHTHTHTHTHTRTHTHGVDHLHQPLWPLWISPVLVTYITIHTCMYETRYFHITPHAYEHMNCRALVKTVCCLLCTSEVPRTSYLVRGIIIGTQTDTGTDTGTGIRTDTRTRARTHAHTHRADGDCLCARAHR